MAFGENGGKKPPQQERLETEIPREWNYAVFREFILDACKRDTETGIVDFDDLPDVIDLGTFHRKTQECVQETLSQGQEIEHGSEVFYEPKRGKILIKKQPTTGENKVIAFPMRLGFHYASPFARREQMRSIGILHSHPAEVTFSPHDIANFLANRDYKLATVGMNNGITDILIATAQTRWTLDQHAIQTRNRSAHTMLVDRWVQLIHRVADKPEMRQRAIRSRADKEAAEDEIFGKLAQYASVNYKFGYYRSDESGIARRVLPPKKRKQ